MKDQIPDGMQQRLLAIMERSGRKHPVYILMESIDLFAEMYLLTHLPNTTIEKDFEGDKSIGQIAVTKAINTLQEMPTSEHGLWAAIGILHLFASDFEKQIIRPVEKAAKEAGQADKKESPNEN